MEARDDLTRQLLDGIQRDFPLAARPFDMVAARLNAADPAAAWSEELIIDLLHAAHDGGALSRIGPVFAAHGIGTSTLAVLAVPEPRLEEIATLVSSLPQVNHNYRRSHAWNLWFVVTARHEAELQETLRQLRLATGLPLLDLPLVDAYYIDLGFALDDGATKPQCTPARASRQHALTAREWDLVALTQGGIPLTARPYAALAAQWGGSEADVIGTLSRWLDDGILRRFGAVLRHRRLGWRANAMCVFDIPDQDVTRIGQELAGAPEVRLCYRRRRALPHWPYNLFCMVHGKDRDSVLASVQAMIARHGLEKHANAVLIGEKCYKQRGAWYAPPRPASATTTPEWVARNMRTPAASATFDARVARAMEPCALTNVNGDFASTSTIIAVNSRAACSDNISRQDRPRHNVRATD
jgi:DNA-binding Lrp family transcriptional regulator